MKLFDETGSFWQNFVFFCVVGLFGGPGTCVFFGAPETGEIRDFFILPDPGCPRDPKVGSHSDCVVSWYDLGGIEALFWMQGPL